MFVPTSKPWNTNKQTNQDKTSLFIVGKLTLVHQEHKNRIDIPVILGDQTEIVSQVPCHPERTGLLSSGFLHPGSKNIRTSLFWISQSRHHSINYFFRIHQSSITALPDQGSVYIYMVCF